MQTIISKIPNSLNSVKGKGFSVTPPRATLPPTGVVKGGVLRDLTEDLWALGGGGVCSPVLNFMDLNLE